MSYKPAHARPTAPRRFTAAVALILAAALAGLGLTAAAADAVNLPLPTCSSTDPGTAPNFVNSTHCWYLPEGTTDTTGAAAGYLGADDGHTRYRFVQTNFTVTPQFVDLNGSSLIGAVGIEECDPNIGYAAQFGIVTTGSGSNIPYYAQGYWGSTTRDPCINHSPLVPNPTTAACPVNGTGSVNGTSPNVFCGSFAPVATGDQLSDFAIYYEPGGRFFHHVSFGFCDTTAGYCSQAYGGGKVNLNFWEIGVGVFSGAQDLTSPPAAALVQFTQTSMNCYTCKSAYRPISVIQPVNSTGTGGLEQVEDVNSSGQAVLAANNSLDANGDFTMYNGSTSS